MAHEIVSHIATGGAGLGVGAGVVLAFRVGADELIRRLFNLPRNGSTKLTKAEHEKICSMSIAPIKEKIDELSVAIAVNHRETNEKFNLIIEKLIPGAK